MVQQSKAMGTRRNALISLKRLAGTHDMHPPEQEQMLEALVTALCDYTTDTRGDVGSWLRIEALKILSAESTNLHFSTGRRIQYVQLSSKLCLDRIDSVREVAVGTVLELSEGFDSTSGLFDTSAIQPLSVILARFVPFADHVADRVFDKREVQKPCYLKHYVFWKFLNCGSLCLRA